MAQARARLDWTSWILLALILGCSAMTVSVAGWAPGLDMLLPTALAGLVIGTLLARSRFRQAAAHGLALAYGAAWVTLTSLSYLPEAVGLESLGERLIAYGRHIGDWLRLLIQTGVGKDNFIFLLSLMIVFWLLGYLAAWYTFRATKVMRVVLLPGLVILVNLYYYAGRMRLSLFLYLYLVCVLLYLARIHYLARVREWRTARVGFDDDLQGAFVRGASIVTAVAVVVAWLVPEFAPMPQFDQLWQQIGKPVRTLEDSFNRLFSALEGQGPVATNPFGRTHGFGGARHLSDTVLMDVYVHKSKDNADALARYWRAGTYDTYTRNGWISNSSESYVFSPQSELLATPFQARSNVRQTFTFYFPRTTLLLAAASPVYFGRDAEADAHMMSVPGDTALEVYVDPSFVLSRDALRAGDAYEVVSVVSTADVDRLRTSGTLYPDWITDRYLQLPDDFPRRVRDLAQEIVTEAGATNPYDQAAALERWLRGNVRYDESIGGPAPGQDGVDWALFESRAGYCDYYAAAMATMARSLGMPARVAIGYARGEYEPAGDVYRVRERDAHTWVEIFFAGYGWVEFEPTAAQPIISRPIQVEATGSESEPPLPPTPSPLNRDKDLSAFGEEEMANFNPGGFSATLTQVVPRGLAIALGATAVLVVVALGTMFVVENRGLRGLRGSRWAYARLIRLARWLKVDVRPHQTPFEQADLLTQAAPENGQEIRSITNDFVRETFGRDDSGAAQARATWRQTHFRLWWAGLRRRLHGALGRLRRRQPAPDQRFRDWRK